MGYLFVVVVDNLRISNKEFIVFAKKKNFFFLLLNFHYLALENGSGHTSSYHSLQKLKEYKYLNI